MRRIYVAGGGSYYMNWMQGKQVWNVPDADLVVFTGGADINPKLYNCLPHPTTTYNNLRDQAELKIYHQARKLNKKLIGICRGAQFLCAMAGGTLVQDSHHPPLHKMKTNDDDEMWVTSSHHQRQFPWGGSQPGFELIGWCQKLSPYNEGQGLHEKLEGYPEVEMASYPSINALAIQSHPEWAYPIIRKWEEKYIKFCRALLDKHIAS